MDMFFLQGRGGGKVAQTMTNSGVNQHKCICSTNMWRLR